MAQGHHFNVVTIGESSPVHWLETSQRVGKKPVIIQEYGSSSEREIK